MKFIHLSEARLGLHNESGRPWEKQRKEEIAETLQKTAQLAEDEKIDLVLIAGGLFAHRPITAELEKANRVFAMHPATVFVIIAGESDIIRGNSPVLSFQWAKNVHYVTGGGIERICLPEISTVIYARSLTDDAAVEQPEPGSELPKPQEDDPEVRIALVYEPSFETASRYNCEGYSYVALGGLPTYKEVIADKAYYCGGLEPEGMADIGAHGYIRGEISPVTGTLQSCGFVKQASAAYVPLLVKINTFITPQKFSAMIQKEIENRGTSNIYRVRITGQKQPQYSFDLEDLKEKYRIAEVIDEAEPQYDFESLFEQHQQDMIGYFISTLRRKGTDLPQIDKKAMFQGIDALIQTSDDKEGQV